MINRLCNYLALLAFKHNVSLTWLLYIPFWVLLSIPWLQKELGEGKLREPSWVLCVTTSFPGCWGLTGVFLWFCNNSRVRKQLIVSANCGGWVVLVWTRTAASECLAAQCCSWFLLQACFKSILFSPLCRSINSDRIEVECQINPQLLVFILNVIFLLGEERVLILFFWITIISWAVKPR